MAIIGGVLHSQAPRSSHYIGTWLPRVLDNTLESGEEKAVTLVTVKFPAIHSTVKPYPEGRKVSVWRVGGVPHTNRGPLCKHQPEILPLKLALGPQVPSSQELLFGREYRKGQRAHS